MDSPPAHPIVRIIEEIEPQETMSALQRRMGDFKSAGVREYWAVDQEGRRIHIFRLRQEIPPAEGIAAAECERIEEKFFPALARLTYDNNPAEPGRSVRPS
jgi:Uma2 family endonuclease